MISSGDVRSKLSLWFHQLQQWHRTLFFLDLQETSGHEVGHAVDASLTIVCDGVHAIHWFARHSTSFPALFDFSREYSDRHYGQSLRTQIVSETSLYRVSCHIASFHRPLIFRGIRTTMLMLSLAVATHSLLQVIVCFLVLLLRRSLIFILLLRLRAGFSDPLLDRM